MKQQEGLVFDLAKYLSKQSQGRYEFQVTYVPRARIETYLHKKKTVVVPFVSPKWFSDEAQTRYLWTDLLMMDQNVVVMQTKSPFDYKGVSSLNGKTMAYLLGHKVPVIDALISDGKIKREESPSMLGNFKKVVEGRADFLVTGEMAVRYIIEREHWQPNLRVGKEPVDVFERRILVSPVTEVALQQWLNSEVKVLIKEIKKSEKFSSAFR
jgi:polar amino acid transport system substrate-binding protein